MAKIRATHNADAPEHTPFVKIFVTLRDSVDAEGTPLLAVLQGAPLAVYVAIILHADKKDECWPSRARLAKLTGYHARTVSRAVKLLADLGLVEVIDRRNEDKSNMYCLNTQFAKYGRGGGK